MKHDQLEMTPYDLKDTALFKSSCNMQFL